MFRQKDTHTAKKNGGNVKLILNKLLSTRDYTVFYPVLVHVIPEPTAQSAVPGVSPGQGFLISLLGEFKVDDGDEIFSVSGPH